MSLVEVGPETIVAPNPVDPELVSAALDSIDDELALVGERAVPTGQLWTELMAAAGSAALVLCPTWWPQSRLDRVRAATGDVEILRRAELFGPVVEVCADFVVVAQPAARPVVIPVLGHPAEAAHKAVAALGARPEILVDRPAGAAAEPVVAALLDHLRTTGVPVRLTDRDMILRAAAAREPEVLETPRRRPRRRVAATAAALLACAGFGLRHGNPPAEALVVEGRVGVVAPADWPAQRVTSGPGSARLQLDSPIQTGVALHLTQADGQESLPRTAETLAAALTGEPGEVFVDFNPADIRAGRPAITYRELRADKEVAWTVLVDDGIAIAIGCQSAPGRSGDIRTVCERAIASAHIRKEGTDPGRRASKPTTPMKGHP